MQRVYVVTHPEATHHVENVVGGWHDSQLTARGRVDAAQVARYLGSVVPAGVTPYLVSSDLMRTRETADEIGRAFGVASVVDPGLRERSYGVAEGRPQRWLDERVIRPPAIGSTLDHHEGIAGAETRREWIARTYATMARVELSSGDHCIIVTHGGTVSWVIAAWMRIPIEACDRLAFRVPSGSVSILEVDDRYDNRALVRLGDRSFVA